MAKLVLNIDRNRLPTNAVRFVIDASFIVGVQELVDGTVLVTTKHPANGQRTATPVTNSFEEVSQAVVDLAQLDFDERCLHVYGE